MVIISLIITPFFLLVWVLTFWWDKKRIWSHMMGTFWAWAYQWLVIFWRLKLEGREKIPWNRPVVLVANHRSFVDILALYKVRRPFKWVSKAENFKIPFIGMVLSLTNCVRIQRGSIRAGHQFIYQAEKEMKKGSSVMIFPEGTRSKTGKMRNFQDGAFVLAKKMNCGIIPIAHIGTEKALHAGKDGWVVQGKTNITITVLDEIPAEQVSKMKLDELKDVVRRRLEEKIEQLEKQTVSQQKS
jgi:1-acyl-sn-glycerol-3-phosphate acyltransferase